MAALPTMLAEDRRRAGWSVGQAAWRLGVSIREYRQIEAGERWPDGETFNRICALFGWPPDVRIWDPPLMQTWALRSSPRSVNPRRGSCSRSSSGPMPTGRS